MTYSSTPPIITIDGPSGSGKGTISARVAEALGFSILDSGALYRILGHAARERAVPLDEPQSLAELAKDLDIAFRRPVGSDETLVFINDKDVTRAVRSEQGGRDASVVALIPEVRKALLERQRAFLRPPGLVADGRDMGTVVFPTANLKIFLTADIEERARRRYNQLKDKEIGVTLLALQEDLRERDLRDTSRKTAPLMAAADAITLDTTHLSIDEVVEEVLRCWRERQ